MGGAERGTGGSVCGSSGNEEEEEAGCWGAGVSVPSSPLLGVGLICNGTGGVGVVDLTTSTIACFVGDDIDLFTSGLVGVADTLTSGSETVEGVGLLTSGTVGVVDLLTSDTGSVDAYLLDSETVAR